MGRRRGRWRKRIKLSLVCYILYITAGLCQFKVTGKVYDEETNEGLNSITVRLESNNDSIIISYTTTNKRGDYKLELNSVGSYNLIVSSFKHSTKTIPLEVVNTQKNYNIDIALTEETIRLNEVIITERPIVVKEDTIIFKTKHFTDGTENSVEDLLKKIPGLSVDDNGTIKVGEQEIEKLMVEGDDLFERGYKVLSKNMPAYPIEEVELLKNFSNNPLLKGIEEGDKVALNLKLDEKSKNIWFGNTLLGYGNDNFYEAKLNLINFGKKNKYYFFSNLNNIGFDATGDIQQLIRPVRKPNEPAVIGDREKVNNLISLSSISLVNFKKERTNFNNAELLSLNAIFNPTEKIKIKTLGFFNWDENDFFKNNFDFVNVGNTTFTNTEQLEQRNKKRIAFGKLDLDYKISKTQSLHTTTKYNYGDFDDASNLLFNGISTIESLDYRNNLLDQKAVYTKRFKDNKVFLLTGRFIYEETPQNYALNQFYYADLFPNFTNTNNVTQSNKNKMMYAGFNAHILDKKKSGNLLEMQLGNEYRKDKLNTTFTLFENEVQLNQPNGFQNQTNYSVNDLYLKGKYKYKIGSFSINTGLEVHQLFNQLENNNETQNQAPFFINPRLGVRWEINEKNTIAASYTYNTTNAKLVDVYGDYLLNGLNSFSRGTGTTNQLESSNLTLNYRLGNWSDRFFATFFMIYSKSHDYFSTNTLVNQNYTLSDKILIKDRELLNLNSNMDYFFKALSTNIKLNLSYTKTNYENVVNNSDFREVKSNFYNYGIEFRSGFNGIFNYHLGTKWNTSEIETTIENSNTNNLSFLDLTFVFSKKVDFQLQTERYYFGNLQNDNSYYFMDFDVRYNLIKDKLNLSLTGKNIFNTETFRNISISDIGTSTTEYRLLPRFVLMKLEYRF